MGPHKRGRRSDDKWNGARTRPDAGAQAPKAGLPTSLQAGSPACGRQTGLSRSEPSSRSPRKAIWRLCRAGACSEHSALPSARPGASEPFPPPTGIGGLPTSLQAGRSRPLLLGPNSRRSGSTRAGQTQLHLLQCRAARTRRSASAASKYADRPRSARTATAPCHLLSLLRQTCMIACESRATKTFERRRLKPVPVNSRAVSSDVYDRVFGPRNSGSVYSILLAPTPPGQCGNGAEGGPGPER